ncbi:hypothetical protein Btru_013794 [Bulinus truncatus]|nr:hypothetical protein Btru_013794 [Bulinus truncatus]
MVNINQLLEAKCMDLMAQLDKATHKKKLESEPLESSTQYSVTAATSGRAKEQTMCLKTSNSLPKNQQRGCCNEDVSLLVPFSESDLTSTPNLLSIRREDMIVFWTLEQPVDPLHRGDSDVSINSVVNGDSDAGKKNKINNYCDFYNFYVNCPFYFNALYAVFLRDETKFLCYNQLIGSFLTHYPSKWLLCNNTSKFSELYEH